MIEAIPVHVEQTQSIGFEGWKWGALIVLGLLGLLLYRPARDWDELDMWMKPWVKTFALFGGVVGGLYVGYFGSLAGFPGIKWAGYTVAVGSAVASWSYYRESERLRPPTCDKCHKEIACEECGWTAPPSERGEV